MYTQVSEQFKQNIRSPSRKFEARIKINNKWIKAGFKKINFEASSTSEENIQLGAAVSTKIEVTIEKVDQLFENTEIPVEIGLLLHSGTFEYIPVGIFTAEHPEWEDNNIKFTAYDRMIKTTKVFISSLTYPASAADVLEEACGICGIPCDTQGLESITVKTKPEGYTCREVIGYVASLYGGFACVDREGVLRIKWYEDSGYSVDASRMFSFTKNESDYHIDYLTCNVDNSASITSGSGTLGITFSNPFMEQEQLDKIYSATKDFKYRAAAVSFLGDPRLDVWDIITVYDLTETSYKVPVMNLNQEYDGGLTTTVTAYGKTEVETEIDYKGPSTQKIDRIYSELTITKELVAKKVDAEWVKANTVTAEVIRSVEAEISQIKTDYIKASEADLKYAKIDLTNIEAGSIKTAMIDTGAIGTAQIADGSITDAKIVGVTADKITAGTIDAAQIEVVNLNAANITVGSINGVQIASGAIDMSKLGSDVSSWISTTESNVDKALKDAGLASSNASSAVTAADSAVSIANGKNTSYYQKTAPSGGTYKVNDIWFDTDDGYKMYYWNGSAWSAAQYGSSAISANAIDDDKIANGAVTEVKISNGAVTADKISANAVTASKIAANSITADKLVVGTNGYSVNPDFANWTGTYPHGMNLWAGSNISKVTLNGQNLIQMITGTSNAGLHTIASDNVAGFWNYNLSLDGVEYLAVEIKFRLISGTNPSGASLLLDFYYYNSSNASTYKRVVCKLNELGTSLTVNTWYTYKKVIKVPSEVTSNQFKHLFGFLMGNHAGSGTLTSKTIQFASLNVYKATEQDYLTQSWTKGTSINGAMIATGTIVANAIASNAITSEKIASSAITAGKIAAGAVTAINIAANAVTADKIAANAVTAGKIAANAVTTSTIATDAVTSAKIAANSITAEHVSANAITTDKIVAQAVTGAKIAASTITANNIAANAVTADKINVSSLSAISANLGTITAGVIQSANYVANSAGMKLNLATGAWDSKYFKINNTGEITASGGTIGSWNITSNSLYSDYDVYRSYIQTAKSADTWVFSVQEKRDGTYYGNWRVTADGRMYAYNKVVIDSSGKDTGSYITMETWDTLGDKHQTKTKGLEYYVRNLTNNNYAKLQASGLWFGNEAESNVRGSITLNDSNLMLTTFDIYRTKNANGIIKGWFRDTVFIMQDGWNNNAIYADWNGNFSCTGTKNRIVETENFGQVKMNAFETAGAYFADIMSGRIAADGKCVIYLDRKFAETIDRDCEYQVILTAVGKASELYVIKYEEYFTVCGQAGTDFDCMIIGRQKGYVTSYADSVDFSGLGEEVSENVIN